MRALLPYIYIGMENNKQPNWMPPMAKKVFLLPLDSSQCGKKREKMKPWRTSRGVLV